MNNHGKRVRYTPEMPDKVYEFIEQIHLNLTEMRQQTKYFRGKAFDETIERGCKLPTIWMLAKHIGVMVSTIYDWEKLHAEFSEALYEYRELQKHFLIQNTLRGYYKEFFAAFVMKNLSDWTDTPKIKVDPKSLSDQELIKYSKLALTLMGVAAESAGKENAIEHKTDNAK